MGARETALCVLIAVRKEEAWSNAALKTYIQRDKLDGRDAALATRLCYGVLQNRALLDAYLKQLLTGRLKDLHPVVRDILHMGLYQIYKMDKIPESAAVNESVQLAKKYCKFPKASGLVNGVNGEPILIRAALESEKGQDMFLKRYAELMGTILNEEYFNQVIDEIAGAIESEVPRDRARWNRTVAQWEKSVQALRDYFKDGKRDKNVLADLKEHFGLSSKEMEYYFGDVMP